MDLFEAIACRHSYRGDFTGQSIPRKHLRTIIEAGLRAPSALNEQTTSFVVVDEPEQLRRLAAIIDRPVCASAKAMIVCVCDPREVLPGWSFMVEDCAAAVENMLLAVTALGYATVWLDGVLRREGKAQRVAELLGVPAGRVVRIVLPLGVPVEKLAQKEKLPFQQRAWFNRWGEEEKGIGD